MDSDDNGNSLVVANLAEAQQLDNLLGSDTESIPSSVWDQAGKFWKEMHNINTAGHKESPPLAGSEEAYNTSNIIEGSVS